MMEYTSSIIMKYLNTMNNENDRIVHGRRRDSNPDTLRIAKKPSIQYSNGGNFEGQSSSGHNRQKSGGKEK